jgi:hypothetical protein
MHKVSRNFLRCFIENGFSDRDWIVGQDSLSRMCEFP